MSKITIIQIKEMVNVFATNYEAIKTLVSFGRFNKNLEKEEVEKLFKDLDGKIDTIKNVVLSGTEDISKVSSICNGHLKTIKKLLGGDLISPIAEEVDELNFQLSLWEKVMNLNIPYDVLIDQEVEKSSREKRKVELKLKSCIALKNKLDTKANAHYNNIPKYNAQIEELNKKLLETTDELLMVRFDSAISDLEDKKVMDHNFASRLMECSRVLDKISYLCQNFLEAGNEYSKFFKLVKASLDIDNFQNIVSDPNKSLATLKILQGELEILVKNLDVQHKEASKANADAIAKAKARRQKIQEQESALDAAKATQNVDSQVNTTVEEPTENKIKVGDK